MTKAALWLRKSTDDQDTDNQRLALEAEAEQRGLEVVKVYDVAASAFQGAHLKALAQVYADARAGRFKVLLVWSLDRLSRQGSLAILEVVKTLTDRNIELVSLQEPWLDTVGPFKEPLLAIMGWIAQYESQRRSERTRAGLARAKAAGTRLGRPPGSKDRRRRKKSGYFRRWADKPAVAADRGQ